MATVATGELLKPQQRKTLGVSAEPLELYHWPIVTSEDEQAVLEVLRAGSMSDIDITRRFEAEYAEWVGTRYGLASVNGTTSLLEAMFGVGLGRGDELIVPSLTYWASALQLFSLGATPVFADIDPISMTLNPQDIERRITPRTKAIMVVHYCGHPCDMDAIMDIARRHQLKVIEDVSHAHGGLYKGRMLGSIGDVGAMSLMSRKGFAIGEGGILCTNDPQIFERAIAFGHYERTRTDITSPELTPFIGLPLGAVKSRLNQMASAMGRVQLRYFPQRMREIQDAMNRFWDLLEGTPGLRPHRTLPGSDSTMGAWYNPVAHYVPEELGGLPVEQFVDALQTEGVVVSRGVNTPLHLHPVLNSADIYHDGTPTRIAFADRDIRQPAGSLPVSEGLAARTFGVPAFKKDWPEFIEPHAAAYRKVATRLASRKK